MHAEVAYPQAGRLAPEMATELREAKSLKANLLIPVVCLLATGWLIFATARIETSYLNNYGYFFDPAAYYLRNIRVFRDFQQQGMWASLVREIGDNGRCPLRTVPYLLAAPQQLATPLGHLWTEAPLIYLFLTLFCSTVYARTRSLYFSISATGAFLGVPFLYDPVSGIGAYWLDFPAACAMASAALCLLRYAATKHEGWMLGFGACASATALCRWSTSAYFLAFVAVAVPFVLYRVWGINWKAIIRSCLLGLLTALPGLIFIVCWWQTNTDYYSTFGFAFNAPILEAVKWTFFAVPQVLGTPLLCTVLLFVAATMSALLNSRGLERTATMLCLWLPTSIFFFLCFIVKAVGGVHPYVYFAPALFIAAFCPLNATSIKRKHLHVVASCLALVGVVTTIQAYEHNRRLANSAPASATAAKQCYSTIGTLIASTKSRTFVPFDIESANPQLEAFFQHGWICDSLSLFSMHEQYLRGIHPGLEPQAMAENVYEKAKRRAALVSVFADPDYALKPGVFNNKYSSAVSHHVATKVTKDPDWKFLATVESPSGLLAIYQNLAYWRSTNPQQVFSPPPTQSR